MITKQKGTYDLLPGDCLKWQGVEELLRRLAKLYNYYEIRTPIFESSDLFHRACGQGSDVVNKETYDFKDRGERNITLRPEGTASVVRAYIENKMYAEGATTKLFYLGNFFRYERPQKGRTRQFAQFGVEALGGNDASIDAEVITLTNTALVALGIKEYTIKLNSIGDLESRNRYKEALKTYFSTYQDELCTDCLLRLSNNPMRLLDCKVDRDKPFFAGIPNIENYLNEESLTHFNRVKEMLDEAKVPYTIDPHLVRGLDYYTHTVFEIEAKMEGFGAQNALGGGGRYDLLVEELEGPKTPAVGMSLGVERLLLAMEASGVNLPSKPDLHVFFLTLGAKANEKSLSIMQELRVGGLSCDKDFQNRALKSQFKLADRSNARFTVIIGDDELEKGSCNVKDNCTDTQEEVSIKELYAYLVNRLKTACSTCKGCE